MPTKDDREAAIWDAYWKAYDEAEAAYALVVAAGEARNEALHALREGSP